MDSLANLQPEHTVKSVEAHQVNTQAAASLNCGRLWGTFFTRERRMQRQRIYPFAGRALKVRKNQPQLCQCRSWVSLQR